MASSFSKERKENLQKWVKENIKKRSQYSIQEWLTFLRHLPTDIDPDRLNVLDESLTFSQWTNAEIQFEWFLRSISSNYVEAFPYLKSFLEKVGRRKFIHPLYKSILFSRTSIFSKSFLIL